MEIFGRLSRLGRIVDRELTDFFRTQGLERWEFDVLATLRRSGNESGLSAGALNKAAMITSGAITNRIDRLTAKGWAERVPDAHDRRAIRVHLTDTGRDLIDRILRCTWQTNNASSLPSPPPTAKPSSPCCASSPNPSATSPWTETRKGGAPFSSAAFVCRNYLPPITFQLNRPHSLF
ncbi:MarR family transcriptional regulator [Nocardia seriolae]|uniref:MarR family winged helix-turn-helix transcriptional regulator n=1 Tax=Nocardia seriolae TaxID=37332 RepID=UPI0031D6FCE7